MVQLIPDKELQKLVAEEASSSPVLDNVAREFESKLQSKITPHTKSGKYAASISVSKQGTDRVITIDRERWGNIEVGFVGRDGKFHEGLHLVSKTLKEMK